MAGSNENKTNSAFNWVEVEVEAEPGKIPNYTAVMCFFSHFFVRRFFYLSFFAFYSELYL